MVSNTLTIRLKGSHIQELRGVISAQKWLKIFEIFRFYILLALQECIVSMLSLTVVRVGRFSRQAPFFVDSDHKSRYQKGFTKI